MKIAIMGGGIAGAYLYRLLHAKGHDNIDIFDRPQSTKCGIKPCAWGTSRGFDDLLAAVGLRAGTYVLTRTDHVAMDGLTIPADLLTFDKKALIDDLLQGAEIRHTEPDPARYDRIIDATGNARSYLPKISDDILLPCIQYRVRSPEPLPNRIHLTGIGYAWTFPLKDDEYHIGCGSLRADPKKTIRDLGWLSGKGAKMEVLCGCKSAIRVTSPHYSEPFVTTGRVRGREVWGVGEAIGCVAPLAGDGIVPGMKSAQLLVESWHSPGRFRRAILKEFRWMKNERRVIDKLRSRESLGLKDAWVLKKNSRRMAMEVGVKQAVTLMNHLRQ